MLRPIIGVTIELLGKRTPVSWCHRRINIEFREVSILNRLLIDPPSGKKVPTPVAEFLVQLSKEVKDSDDVNTYISTWPNEEGTLFNIDIDNLL